MASASVLRRSEVRGLLVPPRQVEYLLPHFLDGVDSGRDIGAFFSHDGMPLS